MQSKGSTRIVVTVVGKDKVGIIASVANVWPNICQYLRYKSNHPSRFLYDDYDC